MHAQQAWRFNEFPGIFVTGTDTGIGKTVVSAAIASLARRSGADAVPMKPVQTGCRPAGHGWDRSEDLNFCLKFLCGAPGIPIDEAEYKLMAPYCFETPCSPHLASRIDDQKISIAQIVSAFISLKDKHDIIIVEGAGGVLVPINEAETMLSLMISLALPVVVVARSGVGTINHTLLTLRELANAKLDVLGVIFNDTTPCSLNCSSERMAQVVQDNRQTIERLGNVPVLGHMPFMENIGDMCAEDFARHCLRHMSEMDKVLNKLNKSNSIAHIWDNEEDKVWNNVCLPSAP